MVMEVRRELVGVSTALCDLGQDFGPVDDADRRRRCQDLGDDGRASLVLDKREQGHRAEASRTDCGPSGAGGASVVATVAVMGDGCVGCGLCVAFSDQLVGEAASWRGVGDDPARIFDRRPPLRQLLVGRVTHASIVAALSGLDR
jgi:hypothetical protein